MLFDQPRELPVATVRRAPTSIAAQLAGALQQWLVARWSFLRPRMVPMLVAAIGLVLVTNAVNYLGKPQAPCGIVPGSSAAPVDPPPSHIKIVLQQ